MIEYDQLCTYSDQVGFVSRKKQILLYNAIRVNIVHNYYCDLALERTVTIL